MSEKSVTGQIPLDDVVIKDVEEHPVTDSVLLHGPPGTGKTTTAAARVAHLLRDHDYRLNQVAWATYRRSLAEDTLERLVGWDVVDPAQLTDPASGSTRNISTIHAIANRIVNNLPQPIESWRPQDFCRKNDLPYRTSKPWEKSAGKELFRCFDWLVNNCYDPAQSSDVRQYPNLPDLRERFRGDVSEFWETWEAYKAEAERIDFHEMLQAVLDQGMAPTRDILVIDEYHDATPLMARVSEQWMSAADIVIVAGDPHQVVNQYEGASPHFFERLEADYPKILLDKSYRVGRTHWRPATRVLAQAHEPPTVETSGTGELIEYNSPQFSYSSTHGGWNTPSSDTPASPVALTRQYGGDIMFLTRSKQQADGICAALERGGVLYRSQSELGGWNADRGETRRVLYNALTKLDGVSPAQFADVEIGRLSKFNSGGTDQPDGDSGDEMDIHLSSTEAAELLRHTHASYLEESRTETEGICKRIQGAAESLTLEDVSKYVTSEFWRVYTQGAPSETQLIKNGRSDREQRALRKALQNNSRLIERDGDGIGPVVQTIHASKGQEANDVVVYDGIGGRISDAMESDEEARKNEWRTWYVALTRASERLHIMRGAYPWARSILPENIRAMAGEPALSNDSESTEDANV